MPALWMRPYPNTLITNSLESAVRIQRDHVEKHSVGISESGFVQDGRLWTLRISVHGEFPQVALKYGAEDGPVISSYSTFLLYLCCGMKRSENLEADGIDGLDW